MSEMGGLRKDMPTTFWTFLIGSAALAGIPPLAGFWSKDEIIADAFRNGHQVVWVMTIVTALLTAFYMTRTLWLTFGGGYRGQGHPHESPRIMTIPLVILAGLAAVAGFFGAPFIDGGFRELVHFGEETQVAGFDVALAGLSVGLALVGVAVGTALYRRFRERDPLTRLGLAYTLLERKYYLDDIYLKGIVRPIQYPIARLVNWTNSYLLDGMVNGAAWLTRKFGRGTDAVDRNFVDGAVNWVAIGTGWTGGLLRYIQSGNVQRYAVILFAGVAILAVIFTRI
jgi:NADH-quinone oxidoreductase subunit L